MLNKKQINRFYVGASHIGNAIMLGHNDSHTHKTLEAAIGKAKEKLENQTEEIAIVVKVVAIIRRKEQPIIVEKL